MNHELSAKTQLAIAACNAEPTRIFTQEELAKVMGLPRSQVPLYMEAAVKRGLVHRNPLPGVLQFAGTPFAATADVQPRGSAAPPAWAPKPMTPTRPGSEQPRRALPSAPAPAAASAGTTPRLCPGCSRSICADKGCIAAQTAPAASAAPRPTSAPTPTPTPAPTPAPTPTTTPTPTPAPPPAPTTMPTTENTIPPIPRFGAKTAGVSQAPSTVPPRYADQRPTGGDEHPGEARGDAERPGYLAAQEFDAWYSVRTGTMRLVGVKVEPDGSVLITPEQLETLRDAAWGKQA